MPLTPPIEAPALINGLAYDYTSISFYLNASRIFEVKSFNYKPALKPGYVYGTGAKKRGRTRGQATVDGGFTMYKAAYQLFLQGLDVAFPGVPYMEAAFDAQISYAELGQPIITDILVGCRIIDDQDSPAEGSDAAVVNVTLDIMDMTRNGFSFVSGDLTL